MYSPGISCFPKTSLPSWKLEPDLFRGNEEGGLRLARGEERNSDSFAMYYISEVHTVCLHNDTGILKYCSKMTV